MAGQLQLRRGTTIENDALVGAPGEVTVDTTLHQLRLHDGETQGGFVVGNGSGATLFDWKFTDHQLSNISWLRADTFSWQSGSVYQLAYQHLAEDFEETIQSWRWTATNMQPLFTAHRDPSYGDPVYSDSSLETEIGTITNKNEYAIIVNGVWYRTDGWVANSVSETIAGITIEYYQAVDGHKIVLADQENNVESIYNATGVAWYYILDVEHQRFKLPRTKHNVVGLRDKIGGYVEAGLPDHDHTYQSCLTSLGASGGAYLRMGEQASTNTSGKASDSNSIYGNSNTVQPPAVQMYLYFFVGNFTQTAVENTAGLNAELFNGKVDTGHQVIAFQAPTAENNYTWYRKYADGWVEQGGQFVKTGGQNALNEQTLSVPMANTAYYANVIFAAGGGDSTVVFGITRTTTTLKIYTYWTSTGQTCPWFVSGMAA